VTYCLSIDLGTSRVKAGVYDEEGTLLASADKPAGMDISKGYCIQQGEDFLAVLKDTVKEVPFDLKKVDVISCTGVMGGTMGIDRNFDPVTIWSATMDTRSLEVPVPDRERVLALCGCGTPYMAQKILMLEQKTPALKFTSIIGFIIGKLTGIKAEDALIQDTLLGWTGLTDLKTRSWSEELISMFGIRKELLPRIAGSLELAGKLSPAMASELGFRSGIGVLAGVGDKVAGCIAAGAINEGDLVDETASYPSLTIVLNSFRPDTVYKTWELLPAVNPGSYYAMHYTPGTGIALNWFVETFAKFEAQEGKKQNRSAYDILEEGAAALSPGSDALLCVPLLAGRILPYEPNIRGLFIGHKLSHTKAHFYRAFLESLAYEYRRCLDNLAKLYPDMPVGPVKSIGGGGAKSALFSQIKSDVLGRTYHQLDGVDHTLLGCALIGFTGIGVFKDIPVLSSSKPLREFVPAKEHQGIYLKMADLYKRAISDNAAIFEELARIKK
jgi:xylulokinase